MKIRTNGKWVDSTDWIKVNGKWVSATTWIKTNGKWVSVLGSDVEKDDSYTMINGELTPYREHFTGSQILLAWTYSNQAPDHYLIFKSLTMLDNIPAIDFVEKGTGITLTLSFGKYLTSPGYGVNRLDLSGEELALYNRFMSAIGGDNDEPLSFYMRKSTLDGEYIRFNQVTGDGWIFNDRLPSTYSATPDIFGTEGGTSDFHEFYVDGDVVNLQGGKGTEGARWNNSDILYAKVISGGIPPEVLTLEWVAEVDVRTGVYQGTSASWGSWIKTFNSIGDGGEVLIEFSTTGF